MSFTFDDSEFDPAFSLTERKVLRRLLTKLAVTVPSTLGDLTDVDVSVADEADSIVLRDDIWTAEATSSPINASSETTYTLGLTDVGRMIVFDSSSPITLEIPPQGTVSWPLFVQVEVAQLGTGQVTIQGGSGVTVNKASAFSAATRERYSVVGLKRTASNTWLLFGDLGAA